MVSSFAAPISLAIAITAESGNEPEAASELAISSEKIGIDLTPELSRTAARNGGVVRVTMQPSREAVSA